MLLTGLLAGLFFGWQCSVINGLQLLPDKEYLLAFQSMNRTILNPVFMVSFLGSFVLLIVTTFLCYKAGSYQVLPNLVIALLVYGVGVIGITMGCNVPLNDTLDALDIAAANDEQLNTMRQSFEGPWNKWHLMRTLAAITSFVCLLLPVLKRL